MKNNTIREMNTTQIIQGDAIEEMKKLPEKSINMLMTSPPYWDLRDYSDETEVIWDGDENCEHDFCSYKQKQHSGRGEAQGYMDYGVRDNLPDKIIEISGFCQKCGAWKGQLGLEPTFDLYIKHLCDIFDEVKRVLRDDGTIWINIGDTYYGNSSYKNSGRAGFAGKDGNTNEWKRQFGDGKCLYCGKSCEAQFCDRTCLNKMGNDFRSKNRQLKDKCLTLIPMRFAIEMVNRGWILRNTIIWHKRNCMPSSVKDRFTVDFEYVFFFSKKKTYYFEAQREGNVEYFKDVTTQKSFGGSGHIGNNPANREDRPIVHTIGRNKRTVWSINPKPFSEAHFAVYPEELCETPTKAGCPEFVCVKCGNPKILEIESEKIGGTPYYPQHKWQKEKGVGPRPRDYIAKKEIKGYKPTCNCNAEFTGGIVLDPFFGSGTTGLVALKQNKKFIGIELNKEYIEIAKKRLKPFLEQTKL